MSLLSQIMAAALALGPSGARDTFEIVTFTPPPGWAVSHGGGERRYVRADTAGSGIIHLLPSRPATGDAARVFGEMWSAHAAAILPGPAPAPSVGSEGEVTVAIGIGQGGSLVAVVAVLWRGRALGVVGMAAGAEAQRELQAFFGTLRADAVAATTGPPSSPTPPPAARPGAGGGELGFAVPPGYVERRNGDIVILAPTGGEATPCIYGTAPPIAASGNLEADAQAALAQVVVPGWRRLDDRHTAMRGVSAAGWEYLWYRAAFESRMGGERQPVNAMAMVLSAGPGRVHVVWGMGSIARCLLDDASFEHLFHSLRPAGWTSDDGRALSRALEGSWRYTASAGLQQLAFTPDGRYTRDLGTRANPGVTERTSTTASEGRFSLRDGELVLTPDHRPGSPDRYRVRVYDEWHSGEWRRAMALLDASASPPIVIPWYRVDQGAR